MHNPINNRIKGEPIERFFADMQLSTQKNLKGCSGMLGALCLARLSQTAGVTLFVCANIERAKDLEKQVKTWLDSKSHRVVCMLPDRSSIYDQTSVDPNVLLQRLAAMSLEQSNGGLVITTISVLSERFYSPTKWIESCFKISPGEDIDREKLIQRLVGCGYRRTNVVEERGTFAVRGSLLDIFSPSAGYPARLDFFGDELESIKLFAPENQRSFDKCASLTIVPANEFIAEPSEIGILQQHIAEELEKMDERRANLLRRKLEHILSNADSRDYRELKPFTEKASGYLTDYFKNCRVIVEEYEQILEAISEIYDGIERQYKQLGDLTPLLPPHFYYHRPSSISELFTEKDIIKFSRFGHENGLFDGIEIQPSPSDPSRETLLRELRELLSNDWAIAIIIDDETRLHNLRGLIGERGVKTHSSQYPFGLKYGSALFIKGYARRGFKYAKQRIAVFTEEDIYPGPAKEQASRKLSRQQSLNILAQIIPGDIVVHSDHGIAEFQGVHTMTAGGNTREYLLLQYAGADKLYVPTDQVHKISKYLGMEGTVPRIHSLNSKVWATQKGKVCKNVEQIAHELLELYAQRLSRNGYSFKADCDLQRQMEGRFPFVETPDQYKAIIATKEDMESEIPMDRLICGDVGYGKTEVAMRATFKAVCSGKQVAILAPTTLLALQHYQTFIKRFEEFPVNVDLICRLKKPAEQREIIKKAKSGSLDVLIGTHRILSSDITFRDLGLLIIDEEQRFGVKHKEKLKQLKAQVDVLTLTATPIPRTMQMAMSGIRQISIIDTPPADRRPVQTYVSPYDSAWVKRAIIEELKRGGQIYYVYNRVEFIEQKEKMLNKLVPEARIAIAHGQMVERQVEKVMLEFVEGKFDILIATTIIESGLDIPNVNTLIVDEAERLGLSQMYQLRGRVGRSSRQAWAYFFYSKHKRLTKEATERLETIEEHTALGSGFKIALRDLQIRGAGNILGESQSGHIASIGFSLYMEMLEEAVTRLKSGKNSLPRTDAAIEIPVTAYLPTPYISDEETRVEIYSRLARCNDEELIDEIFEECNDRFGNMPTEAQNLFSISRLRVMASKVGIIKITRVISHLRLEFAEARLPDIGHLFSVDDEILSQIYFEPKDKNTINLNIDNNNFEQIYENAFKLLSIMCDLKQQNDELRETENESKQLYQQEQQSEQYEYRRKLQHQRKNKF